MNSHWWCRLLLLMILVGLPTGSAKAAGSVVVLTVNDAIGPANADYVVRGLTRAVTEGAQLVVINLDTPGGLDTSMRLIIKAILASPLPVASFVAPSGARAASAGTYILYASHIAAMTPGTNLGAATPVQIGGLPGTAPEPPRSPTTPTTDKNSPPELQDTLTRKQINDAAAYIRGLAQLRGRNADWAEQAVRESLSLSADEALKLKVVDYVANDVADLLKQLDGKSLNVAGQTLKLSTAGATLIDHAPDWRTQLLAVITNPSVALLLIMIGVYGLMFEFMNPGSGVGGVLGGICLLLGLYALQLLPVNYAGVGLILLGLAFMIAEAFLPSFGVIGFGGVVAFVVGAVILMDTDVPGFGIPLTLIIGMALTSALLLMTLVGMALKARRRALVSGDAGLVGSLATVTGLLPGLPMSGWVQLQGEKWQVRSNSPLRLGQQVRVVARKGVLLDVTVQDETPPLED
ncbi:hypothetical protein D3C86_1136450 [compost metagenome]